MSTKKKKIILIADFFVEDIAGGGELNNDELLSLLREERYEVKGIRSKEVTEDFLSSNSSAFFILANFIDLSPECRKGLLKYDYVLYEHDHKYLPGRNPSDYPNLMAPSSHIINYDLYKNAKTVFAQSVLHQEIMEKNLKLSNIRNLGGSLWGLENLNEIRRLSNLPKDNIVAIMDSDIWHKNTRGAIKYCEDNSFSYKLIKKAPPLEFLRELASCESLAFFPQTPETLSRIVVEARMLGLGIHTHGLVGAMSEKWIKLKGEELIDFMIDKKQEIIHTIKECLT